MKKLLSSLLALVLMITLLSACAAENPAGTGEATESLTETPQNESETIESEKDEISEKDKEITENLTIHTLYFKDGSKSSKAVATFFNSGSGVSEDVEMEKVSEDNDAVTFSCEGDTAVYNMAYVTYGEKKTNSFAFNKCVSGWYQREDDFFPYQEGGDIDYAPEFDDVTLTGYGFDKNIHIWKPGDYDASSDEKYSTVYVLDGQNVADFGITDHKAVHCPGVIEQIKTSISETGTNTIVVAIETYLSRDYELTPDLEAEITLEYIPDDDRDYDSMNGSEFAYFAANKLVPYIQEHYNVYTDARHTSITGNSLGGLESFYITLEYPETFGTLGALSPSFLEFEGSEWTEYLSRKSFSDNSPLLYFYTGPTGADTDPDVTNMYKRLKEMGYPEEKLVLHFNENGTHSHIFWRSVFSEFLTAMIFQRVETLQSAVQ